MGFAEAIRVCLRKYVDFNGRARRSEYWWFVLFALLVGMVAGMIDRAVAPGFVAAHGQGPTGMLASLALLLPTLGVSVRRLHDINRSGWWILGFYVVLMVLVWCAIAAAFTGHALAAVAMLLVLGVLAIWLVVWFVSRGTVGANRFGPDPLANDAAPTPSPAPMM